MMRIRYLLVEDNQDHADLIRAAFEKVPEPTLLAHVHDGEAAMAILRPPAIAHPRPDVVLLDINLPRMNGFQLLRAIKADQSLRRTPVVMLTTSRASRDVREAYESGANGYVCKPNGYSELCRMVGTLTDYWSRVNVNPY